METVYLGNSRFMGRPYAGPIPARQINQRVRRIEWGEAVGTQYTQYTPYSDGYAGGSYSEGRSGGGEFLGNLIVGLLLGFGESDGFDGSDF